MCDAEDCEGLVENLVQVLRGVVVVVAEVWIRGECTYIEGVLAGGGGVVGRLVYKRTGSD